MIVDQPAHSSLAGGLVAEVLTPVALDQTYSYIVPPHLAGSLAPGQVVHIPFGPRETVGVVWELRRSSSGGNLKAVAGILDVPSMPAGLRRLVDRIARYTLAPRGSVLSMALRRPMPSAPSASPSACGWPARRQAA